MQVYKNRVLEALDLACYFNIILFCLVKLFFIVEATKANQTIIAYVSVSITFALFIAVIAFHVLTETCSIKKILKSIICQRREIDDNVGLDDSSPSTTSQRGKPVPTVSVVDAPTNHGEQCYIQLEEPLLTS